ncbi:indoleamine 2,3-dioxygenase beta type [Delphinella strobiligena]|nr:indoleamine 2,3-dioxygenase beta type [Delphinella strobiligena]
MSSCAVTSNLLRPIPDPKLYGVSFKYGFLPSEPPLQRLPDPYYAPWERLATRIPALILSQRFRGEVDKLPILSTERLITEADWQRACCILGFATHSYIWAGDRPAERLPPSITVPFLRVAAYLEITPCAPYAVTNLFNWSTFAPDDDASVPENLTTNLTYTGSSHESWFYLISCAMEARGARVFPQLIEAMQAVRSDSEDTVTDGLIVLAECINDLSVLLGRMYERCDPYVFYHIIRPFLAGSKNMAAAGLPKGVFYDEGDGKGEWRQYSGGSNAQSSLIQLFDAFLGVKHYATANVFQDMRLYMPGGHRRFLEAVETSSGVQSYSLSKAEDHPTRKAYEAAVAALAALRSFHIQLVTRYIITPSRITLPWQSKKHLNLATASSEEARARGKSLQLHGTGGTTLIPFLRQCRDETNHATSAPAPNRCRKH